MERFSTLDSEIEVTDSKMESSPKGVNSSSGTEYDSDIQNSQLIPKNSATHEELTDKNEQPLEADAPNDVENVEADHCEADTIKSVKEEEYDDCLSDTLHLHLDIEPTKDDNSTCTPANEGSDLVF